MDYHEKLQVESSKWTTLRQNTHRLLDPKPMIFVDDAEHTIWGHT